MRFDPERLKALRKNAGYSSHRAAAIAMLRQTGVDVTAHTWGNWERGDNVPGSNLLAALAGFFGVRTDDFFSPD